MTSAVVLLVLLVLLPLMGIKLLTVVCTDDVNSDTKVIAGTLVVCGPVLLVTP